MLETEIIKPAPSLHGKVEPAHGREWLRQNGVVGEEKLGLGPSAKSKIS